MKGFIFSAGFGERLLPITEFMPKSLVPVLNLPSICFAIMLLKEAGIEDIICNLHYRYRDIIDFFEKNNHFGLNITFSIEEKILGTGGGVKKCEKMLCDDDFVIVNSDVVMDIDLAKVINYHKKHFSPATLILKKTEEANLIGPVAVVDGTVVDFKNFLNSGIGSNFIYTGAAVLSPDILQYLTKDFSSIVYTGYVDFIRHHSIRCFELDDLWLDIGTIFSLWKANMILMKNFDLLSNRLLSTLDKSLETVSRSAFIDKGVEIKGAVIGNDSFIGKGSIVEDSIVLPYSRIDGNNTIKNSIVYGDRIIEVG